MLQSGIFFMILVGTSFGATVANNSTVTLANLLTAAQVDKLIVGGNPASTDQFPYMASLQFNGNHFCGGSVIQPSFLLTAGHCSAAASRFSINTSAVVGTNTLYSGNGTRYGIKRFITHPDYNKLVPLSNDIGLVETKIPMVYSASVKPIEIYLYSVSAGQKMVLSGWGKTSSTSGVSTDLKCATFTNWCPLLCWLVWGSLYGEKQLCAFGNGVATACQGDSGSGMTHLGKLVGLTSYGNANCDLRFPTVFTRVLPYKEWIEQNVS